MKIGNKARVKSLDYFTDSETGEPIKRPQKFKNKTGTIIDINLGIFKLEFDKGGIEYFDGRELEFAEPLKTVKVDWVFVSWQRNGKSIFGTEDETKYFTGDFRRGVHFKGNVELDEEEIRRVKEGLENGIRPVFDLHIVEGDRRKNRR